MYEISETVAEKWKTAVDDPDCQIIALTGAGISAESGIPTFRGEDGYWKIGSLNYTPMEMATLERFRDYPIGGLALVFIPNLQASFSSTK